MNQTSLLKNNRKKMIALGVIILSLVIVRIFAHGFLLKKTQSYLATFSPIYKGHVEDLRISLWRGAYGFEKLTLTLRDKPILFLEVDDIDVSIDWKELFRGHIRTDIHTQGLKLLYSDYVLKQISKSPEENAEQAKSAGSTLFPISIEKITFASSTVTSSDFFGVSDKLPMTIENITAELTNLTPRQERQISYFQLKGDINETAPLEISGNFNMFQPVVDWEVKAQAKDFSLKSTNPWMVSTSSLSFKEGSLNLFTEARSINKKIVGYAKPFAKDVAMIGDDDDFQGFKQFGIEITLAALNKFFQNAENKTVAAKVDFSYEEGKFDWNFWQVLGGLFKNGYGAPLPQGFEASDQ